MYMMNRNLKTLPCELVLGKVDDFMAGFGGFESTDHNQSIWKNFRSILYF